jgi:hypothetical protein
MCAVRPYRFAQCHPRGHEFFGVGPSRLLSPLPPLKTKQMSHYLLCAGSLASFLLSLRCVRAASLQFLLVLRCIIVWMQHTVHDSPPSPRGGVVCCFLLLLHPLSFFNIYIGRTYLPTGVKKNTLCEIVNPMHHQINMRRQ